MSKQKVTLWIEEGEVEQLKGKYNTDNQSAFVQSDYIIFVDLFCGIFQCGEIAMLNKVVGIVLMIHGIVTVTIKLLQKLCCGLTKEEVVVLLKYIGDL